ncbi:Vacuolar protein sorting-associated protein 8, partial [Blyttiomyces sp. JEL0837]
MEDGLNDKERESHCYVLYVYLSYVLCGKAFPTGVLGRKESLTAKTDVYNFLLSEDHARWPPEGGSESTVIMGEAPYPYLRLLLQYDASEFFRMMSLAFDDASMDGEIHVREGYALDGKVRFADQHSIVNRQYVTNCLLDVFFPQGPGERMSVESEIEFCVFFAKIYVKHRRHLIFEDDVIQVVFEVLITSEDQKSIPVRQAALLSVIKSLGMAKINYEKGQLLEKCEQRGFWRIAEFIYLEDEKYGQVLLCYLQDQLRQAESFQCLNDLLAKDSLTYAQTWEIKQAFIDNVLNFVRVDPMETVITVMNFFP